MPNEAPSPPSSSNAVIYGVDDVPPTGTAIALGIQHYLTMFGSTLAIPLLMSGPLGIADDTGKLAALIATMFFVSGITTLLQVTWGNRLPIIQGGTFSILGPAIIVISTGALAEQGFEVKMQHLQGAIILGGAIEIFFGYTGLIGKLLRFIGPITIAPTIALIGLALFKFGAPIAGKDWLLGGVMIGCVILFSQILRDRVRAFALYPILLAILITWGLAAVLTATGTYSPGDPGFVSLDKVAAAEWIALPMPFPYGMPSFEISIFIAIFAGFLSSMIESIGDYYACARLAGAPTPTPRTINRGIGMEGIGSVFAGIMGTGNATTSYSENIGAIGLTKVGSRRVIIWGAATMLLLGLLPKFSAVFTSIPGPVVGGMYCVLFGMIASVGLSNLQFVDLNSSRNLFIIGFAFFMGLSMPEYFAATPVDFGKELTWLSNVVNTIGQTGMAVGAIIACTLDNLVPGSREERGLAHMHGP